MTTHQDDSDEAAELVSYRAANGHVMQYYESLTRPGTPARASAWNAWCDNHCPACGAGEPLPDW